MYKLQFIGEKCSDVPMYLVPTELTLSLQKNATQSHSSANLEWIPASRSVGNSVDSKSLKPVGFCFLSSVGTISKGATNNRTPTSPTTPSLPHSKPNKPHTARGLHLHRRSPLFLGYTNLFIGTVSHDTIFLKEYSARKPPWPHSKPSRGCGTVRQWRGCGLRHAARTDARRCRGTVRSPSATSA